MAQLPASGMARMQIAELKGRLEKQPGTARLRAARAGEAAALLKRLAARRARNRSAA
jgi:hypothetical protein